MLEPKLLHQPRALRALAAAGAAQHEHHLVPLHALGGGGCRLGGRLREGGVCVCVCVRSSLCACVCGGGGGQSCGEPRRNRRAWRRRLAQQHTLLQVSSGNCDAAPSACQAVSPTHGPMHCNRRRPEPTLASVATVAVQPALGGSATVIRPAAANPRETLAQGNCRGVTDGAADGALVSGSGGWWRQLGSTSAALPAAYVTSTRRSRSCTQHAAPAWQRCGQHSRWRRWLQHRGWRRPGAARRPCCRLLPA